MKCCDDNWPPDMTRVSINSSISHNNIFGTTQTCACTHSFSVWALQWNLAMRARITERGYVATWRMCTCLDIVVWTLGSKQNEHHASTLRNIWDTKKGVLAQNLLRLFTLSSKGAILHVQDCIIQSLHQIYNWKVKNFFYNATSYLDVGGGKLGTRAAISAGKGKFPVNLQSGACNVVKHQDV